MVPVIIANTDAYDVILGMDFLGPLFAYVDPLTEEFNWRKNCHKTETMPCFMARLLAKNRAASMRERRYGYMIDVVESTADLHDAILGDETKEETFDEVHFMDVDIAPAAVPIKLPSCTSFAVRTSPPLLTNNSAVHRRHQAEARLNSTLKKNIPVVLHELMGLEEPTTEQYQLLPVSDI